MNCSKCGAPTRYMPPDGDLRYDPPISFSRVLATETWQTMDNAPMDGTSILLLCGNDIRVGWWSEDGWYDDEASSHKLTDLYGEPTEWCPIPPRKK